MSDAGHGDPAAPLPGWPAALALLRPFALLLGCQLAGELAARGLDLPVPGAVVGCALLLGGLTLAGRRPAELTATADGLLRHLPLLFVPAGVGVIAHADLLRDEGGRVLLVLLLSTALTLAASAWVFLRVARRLRPPGADDARGDDVRGDDARG